jgi:hypothetical protein
MQSSPSSFLILALIQVLKKLRESLKNVLISWILSVEYIRMAHQILRPGGLWLNFGPLTYHHEDSNDTLSLELPFQMILQLVEQCGFKLDKVMGKGELPPSRFALFLPENVIIYFLDTHAIQTQCSNTAIIAGISSPGKLHDQNS